MSTKGLFSREYVNRYYHLEWSFNYTVRPGGSNVQYLEKMDLDYLPGRDRIKIWGGSVRAFIQEKTDIVSVKMDLPQQVDRIIIFRFGQREPVLYAENVDDGVQVYPGQYGLGIVGVWGGGVR